MILVMVVTRLCDFWIRIRLIFFISSLMYVKFSIK